MTAGPVERLVERAGLRTEYPDTVHAEVERWLEQPGIADPALVDLTDRPFVTIDHRSSMDLDQALHIARAGNDGYRVLYALADAAYYVPSKSALFAEALARGASFYLPGRCVPMLPRALSEGLVSLNPGLDRRALVFDMALDARGHAVGTRVYRARVHSRAKLSFRTVQGLYDRGEQSPVAKEPFAEALLLLKEVGLLRAREARARDVIPFDRDEIRVTIEAAGEVTVRAAPRHLVEEYNAQISLLCNMEGARLLSEPHPRAQPIYRVHPAPPEGRVDGLEARLQRLTAAHGLPPGTWLWQRGKETLADYLERLPRHRKTAAILQAIQRQVVLIFERSLFQSEPGRHYALAVDGYSRFSSPMREIAGIFTHKEALEAMDPALPAPTAEEDLALRDSVVAAANRAKDIQRRLDRSVHKLGLDAVLRGDLARSTNERPLRHGTVLGVRPSRLYVRLDDPPMEIKVYTADLERALGCRLEMDPVETELRPVFGEGPTFRIGDRIRIRTAGNDERRHRWRLTAVP